LRVLNAAIERSCNLGFSDGRTFYVIASDGGLLDAPVPLTRYLLHAGERIELLINCTGQNGTSTDLKAYNSTLGNFVAGGENFTTGPFGNALGKKDFNILHLNIGTTLSNPITSVPTTLTKNILLKVADAAITRKLTFSDSSGVPNILGPNAFIINHKLFNINDNTYQVSLNNTEIWEISSSSIFGHPFHIHDVEFNIISVNGAATVASQAGWKDVVFIPGRTGTTPTVVKFIAKFDDYADAMHPFMFHCHISLHEDEGMMGQFVVIGNQTGIRSIQNKETPFSIYPNPAKDQFFIKLEDANTEVYYLTIINANVRNAMMLPQPEIKKGIDISSLASGIYSVQIMDKKTKSIATQKFLKL